MDLNIFTTPRAALDSSSPELVMELGENTVTVRASGYTDRPLELRLDQGRWFRFQRFSTAEGWQLIRSIRAVLAQGQRRCVICSRMEHEVAAFVVSADGAARICNHCVADAAGQMAKLLPAA